jgi:hypothetical protein
MPKSRRAIAQIHGKTLRAASLLVCGLLLTAGCKTQEDAAAAATQMLATAKSLCDYYSALNTILANKDKLYILNEQILSKPYTAASRQYLKNDEAGLAKRAALAADFSTLAGNFAKLTGSTASADVSASAVKLQSEVAALASVKASTGEQNILKSALQLFVTAVQEHKEREAAKAIDSFSQGLTALFVKESDTWNSVETVNTQMAQTLAVYLVDHDATDNSALLNVALDPFGLTPSAASPDLKAQLASLARQQIATRAEARDDAYLKATEAMTKSLQEMSRRIHLVAEDKPMAFRMPPATVTTVEKWATQVVSY